MQSKKLGSLKAMVDLGSNFYVQARVPDTTYIYVNIGFGFHVQLTLDEAVAFIEKKTAALQKQADRYTEEAASISARIELVREALTEVMNLQNDEQPPKRDDLFW